MSEADAWSKLRRAWALTERLHSAQPGATDADLTSFETASTITLPTDWSALYRYANGANFLDGNLNLYPLQGSDLSLREASGAMISWNWPIPPQLLLAGDNGAGSPWGLWLPSQTPASAAVVQTEEVFEPDCLAIAATSLTSFLLARTAYYLLLLDASPDALDALGLPNALRSSNLDDEIWRAILSWADPGHPTLNDDPFSARLNATAVNAALRVAG